MDSQNENSMTSFYEEYDEAEEVADGETLCEQETNAGTGGKLQGRLAEIKRHFGRPHALSSKHFLIAVAGLFIAIMLTAMVNPNCMEGIDLRIGSNRFAGIVAGMLKISAQMQEHNEDTVPHIQELSEQVAKGSENLAPYIHQLSVRITERCKSIVPHMEIIADLIAVMREENVIYVGEFFTEAREQHKTVGPLVEQISCKMHENILPNMERIMTVSEAGTGKSIAIIGKLREIFHKIINK